MSDTPVVYIVDDDEAVRESVAALLSSHGYTVETFGHPEDFLRAATPHSRGCALLDVRLPELSGIEVLKTLSEAGVRLPVVMITAYGDVPLAVSAMRAGAVDFLEKPYAEEDLLASIADALAHQQKEENDEGERALVASRVATLTPRELEVLDLLVAGKQNKQIAYDLGISPRTVEIHRARVMEKMAATNLSHLVRMVITARVSGGAHAG